MYINIILFVPGVVSHGRSASFRDNTTRVPAVYVGSVSQPLYGAEPSLQPEVAKVGACWYRGSRGMHRGGTKWVHRVANGSLYRLYKWA